MRFASPNPASRPIRVGCLLAVAMLAGCSRDLALPSPPTSPALTGFAPAAAYAGQLLRVAGSHFDADPASNTVNFAHASVRGLRFDGTDLVVRVPADAGDGAITVGNRDGTSEPSPAPFDYLGLGEPRRIQVASEAPILQRPRAVLPATTDVAIDSGLFGGLVWATKPSLVVSGVGQSAADATQQFFSRHVYADSDPTTGLPRLVLADGATGAPIATRLIDSMPWKIVLQPPPARVLTFYQDTLGNEVVAAWSEMDLSPIFGPVGYGIEFFFGAADMQNGAVVIAGVSGPDYDLKLWRYDASWTPPATAPVAVPMTCTPTAGLTCPPPLALDSNGMVPLAGSTYPSGYVFAAAPLEGGDIVVAQASGTAPSLVPDILRVVQTYNASPIESLVVGPGSMTALATKPAAGYSVAFSLGGGGLEWILDSNVPTATSTARDPNAGDEAVYIASDGDNDVVVANWLTGQRIARVNFDVKPGARDYAEAATYLPAASGVDGDLFFPSTAFPGLIRFPIGAGMPTAVSPAGGIACVASSPDARDVWFGVNGVDDGVTALAPPLIGGLLGIEGGGPTSTAYVALPDFADPQLISARGTMVVTAHAAGLSLVDGAAAPTVAEVAAITGAASPLFLGLGFTPAGDVWTVVQRDADTQAQIWSTTSIAVGGTPTATWSVPDTALAAAWLEEGLWVFWYDSASGGVLATLLDDGMLEVRTVPTGGALTAIHAVSPNGRLLAYRETSVGVGFPVRFFRADPGLGFPEVGRLVFENRVTGLAFDATGERLYVLTQGPDRIVTID
jgi:hypothetical protein